ncbi:MAG: hypothetical protein QG653_235 [Patescibacteria group bacterium]|nr:hypothetical protein [Patescibacteria group bacterium]
MPRIARNLLMVFWIAVIPFSAQALEAKQYLNFKIVIPTVLFLQSATVTQGVVVSNEDVSRGYVDVPTQYVIVSNSKKGFIFEVTLGGAQSFTAFQVINHNTEASTRFSLSLNAINTSNKQISFTLVYRFWFNQPEIHPGMYQWPVVVTLIQN